MKKTIRLYNVIFPIWFLLIFPVSWLVVLPANFVIDTAVLLIAMACMKIQDKKQHYAKSIWLVWVFGFVSDLIGAGVLFLTQLLYGDSPAWDWWYENITMPVALNPFSNSFGFAYVLLAVAIAALAIFLLNWKISFRFTTLEEKQKKRLALTLAIATAPYLFFLPTELFSYF